MDSNFITLSEIKNLASKRALTYYYQSNSTKLVKQLMGVNPLNREWVDDALNKIKNASQSQGFIRVKYLIQCLEVLYFCEWILKQNSFNDNEVLQNIHRAETLYLNTCLNFIEQNIHSSTSILHNFSHLFSAVNVLSETNVKMGQKYKQMLTRYQALNSSFNKVYDLCYIANDKFTNVHSQQIASLIVFHESSFKMYPGLKEDILETIKNKLDEILIESRERFESINSDYNPSLKKLYAETKYFYDLFSPLRDFFKQKRYKDYIELFYKYDKILSLLENDYQEWLKVYQYYSFPRNIIEENSILNVIKSINKNSETMSKSYQEIIDLNPSLHLIKSFLESLLNQQDKESIINYYKIENDILNTPDSEKKIEEIIRFLKHLSDKISNYSTNCKLSNELVRMRKEFFCLLDHSIEYQIRKLLTNNSSVNVLKDYFDKILNYFYELNDIDKISYWKNIKKQIMLAIIDSPAMFSALKKDYEFFKKLPESNAKSTLIKKIQLEIDRINDIVSVMTIYQIANVQEYLMLITEIESSLVVSDERLKSADRLIILDKYTTKNIVVFGKNELKIGRESQENDIILKSEWISGYHCTLDFFSKVLIDNNSTNGTFINHDRIEIQRINLDKINFFSVADAFDILINDFKDYCILKVVKVYDNDLLLNDRQYIENLFNTDFVWLKKYSSVSIDTFTGNIKKTEDNNNYEIVILNDNNFSIIDKENSQSIMSMSGNEEINTDRFTIHFS